MIKIDNLVVAAVKDMYWLPFTSISAARRLRESGSVAVWVAGEWKPWREPKAALLYDTDGQEWPKILAGSHTICIVDSSEGRIWLRIGKSKYVVGEYKDDSELIEARFFQCGGNWTPLQE